MTSLRTVRHSLLAATVAGAAVLSLPAAAEVSANAAVSNVYLWRGLDLGAGVPAVSGGLDYGHESGLYAGVWGSSSGPTQEVDVYAGWAKEFDGFSVDIGYYDYNYPGDRSVTSPRGLDFEEVKLSAGAAGFEVQAWLGMGETGGGADNENNYYAASYAYDKFTALAGMTDNDCGAVSCDYTHLDVSYAYNDNLTFTVSKIVDTDLAATEPDALFVVGYSLPLDLPKAK